VGGCVVGVGNSCTPPIIVQNIIIAKKNSTSIKLYMGRSAGGDISGVENKKIILEKNPSEEPHRDSVHVPSESCINERI